MGEPALIGIVVVDYAGGDRTNACLQRLHELTWPAGRVRIVVVDNAARETPGTADLLRATWPRVEVLESTENSGFAGGCNAAFHRLRNVEYVAVVNNDALPRRDWLEPLVATMESDATLGAAMPKVLLAGDYRRLRISSSTTKGLAGDSRSLGVQISGVEVDGKDEFERTLARQGLWGWEHDAASVGGRFRWTDGDADLLIPIGPGPGAVRIRISNALGPMGASIGGVTATADITPAWIDLGATGPGERVRIINSAGLELRPNGEVADRGYLEPDDGFDATEEVFGWSGAAVLLRRTFIDDAGGFDPRFFLYYEDADLSWRGRLRGWRYLFVPASLVEHEHAASVGASSPLAEHLTRRNRLLMLTKDGPAGLAARAVSGLLADLYLAAWRDVAVALASRRPPRVEHAGRLARVAAGYVRLLPGALAGRVRVQNGRDTTPMEVVRTWAVSGDDSDEY